MKKEILFADTKYKQDVDELRMQEYAMAKGYSVDLETLRWKVSDDESFVMIATCNDRVVSTMRGEIINDRSVLEKKIECPWDFDEPLKLPVLLLSRAATAKSHQSQGLNLVLRYWFLKFAEFHGIPLVVGTFVDGSPRQNTLLDMGYRFFENKLGWQQSTYRSHRRVIVAALDMNDKKSKALSYCEDRLPKRDEAYLFRQSFPEIKYVRNL